MDVAVILHSSSIVMLATGVITIAALYYQTAPYGRYSTPKGWGILIPAPLAWFIMESPNLWMSGLVFYFFRTERIQLNSYDNLPNCILLGCFLLHYFHRSIIYPLKMNTKVSAPMPLTVMLLAFTFCVWNGSNQALSLLIVSSYKFEYIYDWKFLVGLTVYFTGMYVNIQSDGILLNLKKRSLAEAGGKNKYYIPYGGMFEYISCANFAGEIVEWIGFAIACQSFPAFAFAFYVIANLGPRALKHHKW